VTLEVAAGALPRPRVAAIAPCFGLAEGEEVQELELRRDVVGQLARRLGERESEVVVEAHALFHGLHARTGVEAAVERAGRAPGADVEEPRVLDGEVVVARAGVSSADHRPPGGSTAPAWRSASASVPLRTVVTNLHPAVEGPDRAAYA
jgi:hypothetical protein